MREETTYGMRGPQNNITNLPLLIQTLTIVINKVNFLLLVLEIWIELGIFTLMTVG